MRKCGKHACGLFSRFGRMLCLVACLLVFVFATHRAFAWDMDTVSQIMRESARDQRMLQAEIRRIRMQKHENGSPRTETEAHGHQHETPVAPVDASPMPEMRTKEDAVQFMQSPEMLAKFATAVEAINARFPMFNAMMTDHPIPGQAFAPLEPLSAEQFQQAIVSSMRDGRKFSLPQFDTLQQWQSMMAANATNGVPKEETVKNEAAPAAMAGAAPGETIVRTIDIGKLGRRGGSRR